MHKELLQLRKTLYGCEYFTLLCGLCCNKAFYVVGGAIRNAIAGIPVTDIDLTFPEDPTLLAKKFAAKTGGSWFWLDHSRLQSRVAFSRSKHAVSYDFAPLRDVDLPGDLGDRDYSINAVALDLSVNEIIDPYGGLHDLERLILRQVSTSSLVNDPLRILKGVRHAIHLGLEIEPATQQAMRENACLLERVAVERIRQEFLKILADENAGKGFWLMSECNVGRELFGEHFDLYLYDMISALPEFRNQWQLLENMHPLVSQWLETDIEQGLNRRTLLLFVLLLRQIEKDLPARVAEKWSLSRKNRRTIDALSLVNEVTLSEFELVARNPRALSLWSKRTGVDDTRTLLLYLSVYDLSDVEMIENLSGWLFIAEQTCKERLPELVYGRWLSDYLGIEEGPEMSKALELLRNAEITGEVTNEEEARHFLSQVYLNSD